MSAYASRLRGSFPPLVTPFRDGEVDFPTFERLVELQVQGGSPGVVVCGTTGQPALLSPPERKELLRVAVATAAGRIAVVAATGAADHATTVELTLHAERAGADAVMIVTPYFTRPPERGLVAYYRDVLGRCALPALIYHIPGRAAVGLSPEAIALIAESCPNLVGAKHASTDLGWVTDLLRLWPEMRIFVGLEEMSLPMLAVGAVGLMNAAGNLVPDQVAELCDATLSGDLARARVLHERLWTLNRAIFWDTNPIPLKHLMHRAGLLPTEEHRLPMCPASPALQQRLGAVLEGLAPCLPAAA